MPANFINPILGDKVLITIQDYSNAAVYAHPAIINDQRSISFSAKTVDGELVDLNDQSAPAQTVRRVASLDLKVDGSGSLNNASAAEYTGWHSNGTVRNAKIMYGNVVVSAPLLLTDFSITGNRQEAVQAQMTYQLAGAYTVVANV